MVDAEDSKSSAARLVGSSPTSGTSSQMMNLRNPPRKPGGNVVFARQACCSDSGLVNRNNALTGKDQAVFSKLMRNAQQRHGHSGRNAALFCSHG